MQPRLKEFYEKLHTLPLFEDLRPSHVNDVNIEGENALHIAVLWDDIEAAKLLLRAGINVNQPGDLGYTPLHQACSLGNLKMVKLLVKSSAGLHALTEGDSPFAIARLRKRDHVCDYLGAEMKKQQNRDPQIWTKARIKQLKAEIKRLEKQLVHKRV